jgi:hypothetical protein
MKIETKFDPGEIVWLRLVHIPNDRPAKIDQRMIEGIRINFEKFIIYQLEKYRGPFPFEYPEHELFKTQMELRERYPELTEYAIRPH